MRELMLPVALKFPVGFVRKKTTAGSVPHVALLLAYADPKRFFGPT
jgi:hypothetical protein